MGVPMPENADPMSALREALSAYDEGGCFDNGGYCGKHRGEPWTCSVTERDLADAARNVLAPETDRDAGLAAQDDWRDSLVTDEQHALDLDVLAGKVSKNDYLNRTFPTAPSLEGARHPEALDRAIEHGYLRGQADERYGRGHRPEVAVRLWRDEEAAQAVLRGARHPEPGETDLRDRIAAEVRRWENGRGGDIVLGDIRAVLAASRARGCPCNGRCHNGHTRTCSEECRGQTVEHAASSLEGSPDAYHLSSAIHKVIGCDNLKMGCEEAGRLIAAEYRAILSARASLAPETHEHQWIDCPCGARWVGPPEARNTGDTE